MFLTDPSFLSFFIAMLALTLVPGADTFLVVRNVLKGGSRDGMITSVGICSGLFVHATLSACGISLILVRSATAFHAMKIAGSIYLLWLGTKSLLAAFRGTNSPILPNESALSVIKRPVTTSLREGLLSNVLNPKTAVFYMALLPQFIAPSDPVLMKSLFLAAIHFVISLFWLIIVAVSLEKIRSLFFNPFATRILEATSGAVLVAFGIRLGTARP